MSVVNITSVNVLDNPAPFASPLRFEIHYECLTDLEEDLEWKLTYVGSAESEKHDQVLDDVAVGPVKQGKFKFVLEANAPNADLIPADDIIGVTVILLTCSYKNAEFVRVGYYASIDYEDEELRLNPPDTKAKPKISMLTRHIIEENPRVTRFANRFDSPESDYAQSQDGGEEEEEEAEEDGEEEEEDEEGGEEGGEEEGQPEELEGAEDDELDDEEEEEEEAAEREDMATD